LQGEACWRSIVAYAARAEDCGSSDGIFPFPQRFLNVAISEDGEKSVVKKEECVLLRQTPIALVGTFPEVMGIPKTEVHHCGFAGMHGGDRGFPLIG
jgi:hypothetical protein